MPVSGNGAPALPGATPEGPGPGAAHTEGSNAGTCSQTLGASQIRWLAVQQQLHPLWEVTMQVWRCLQGIADTLPLEMQLLQNRHSCLLWQWGPTG